MEVIKNYVYWIYNEECVSPETCGYIGVTYDPDSRFRSHQKKNKKIPNDSKIMILFEGTREECFQREYNYRPKANIGWNNAVGGSHGWRLGFTHSDETKTKMKAKWTDERKEEHIERLKTHNHKLRGQKRPKQTLAISGEKNGMFGQHHSEESKMKMSIARKGRPAHNKQNIVCPICGKSTNATHLKKYHGLKRNGERKKACN